MTILERRDANAIAHLRMNAPERLNALSDEMLAALQEQIDALKNDSTIKAVVLSGEGKAFCAGHDIRQMNAGRAAEDGGKAYFEGLFARCTSVMLGLQRLPQPVIAQVHGIATAAGCQLVASCDLAVAAQGTRFGVNGVNIGLFCSTPMVALSRNIPRKHAFELLTTGEFMSADRAAELGLINRAVPEEDLETETLKMAETIASKLRSAVKIGKEAYYRQIEMPLDEAYAYTSGVIVENLMHRDTIEGLNAFIEKRPPNWEDN
ncbi:MULTISPECIES: enoyl-CoA hydratase [Rhodobacterales]|jgi:enoyl-CoA hydratase/carnithine racemase|uniref:enoyl-CoA hydratase n=1 Tax=Rhodobacterales TaxID=204455 RepID=UPI00237F8D65|nr:enoyl-CoA hydratase [Phaeobacter gallaeciensis]MDE4139220.1 enoyl-CoA hydratase [Phaeobacter gallaeciensis]MDE4147722.1 enoyl-CoA hydratase [Phaeobacter gallaeciensis]MDE4151941.1 enoyl-CoA hydratase [Phaeobacter gallaeciensis]MDE4227275.1 enoyl-CoA hydratase [Phaeobacter gallaeciensis]MDE4256405.1 enoyl-CoA hydratase [Phaeobacter gallaeciensis]